MIKCFTYPQNNDWNKEIYPRTFFFEILNLYYDLVHIFLCHIFLINIKDDIKYNLIIDDISHDKKNNHKFGNVGTHKVVFELKNICLSPDSKTKIQYFL